MAASEKVYYLENDKKRFWEISVRGSDSVLRYGKVGCKGRTCAAKTHESPARCRQWAVIQANMKRFEGYDDPVEKNSDVPLLKRRVTSIQAERLGLSRQKTVRLENSDVVEEAGQSTDEEPPNTSPSTADGDRSWRKPHRKQTTIRAIGEVINYKERHEDEQEKGMFRPPLTRRVTSLRSNGRGLSKQNTVRLQTNATTNNQSGQTKRQNTLTKRQSTASKKDWRKPHKKQTTIRALGVLMSFQERHADQQGGQQGGGTETPSMKRKSTSLLAPARQRTIRLGANDANSQMRQTKRQQTLANKQKTVTRKEWRKPPKKQSTIRRVNQQTESKWRKPHKKQGTIRTLAKQLSHQ